MTTPTDALERPREAAASGELTRSCQEQHIELLVVFGSMTHEE